MGNSGAKWRLLCDDTLIARGVYRADDPGARRSLLECADQLDEVWIASVAGPEQEAALAQLLAERWAIDPWFARTAAITGDLRNSYVEPARMGVDRWLAMLGARRRHRGRVCVIDAGSALTIDIVNLSLIHI